METILQVICTVKNDHQPKTAAQEQHVHAVLKWGSRNIVIKSWVKSQRQKASTSNAKMLYVEECKNTSV